MIKLTRLDGSEMYVNEDLIEIIEETPDTHITLTNGHRYVVLEKVSIILERIIAFKARMLVRSRLNPGRPSLRQKRLDGYHPYCKL